MIQINYLDKQYLVPSHPMEMMLEQFIDLYCLIRDAKDNMNEDTIKGMLSILTGIPLETIKEMKEMTLNHLVEECHSMLATNMPEAEWKQTWRKEPAYFEMGGDKYEFQPHYGFSRLGVIRLWEDFLGDRKLDIVENLHYIIALTARTEGEKYDSSKINDKARLVLDSLRMEDCYHPLFVFIRTRNEVLMAHERLFKKTPKQEDETVRTHTASPSSKLLASWGWYHIANKMIENGNMAETLNEIYEMNMLQVFEHLSYMHDMSKAKEMENKRREQAMAAQQPRRYR